MWCRGTWDGAGVLRSPRRSRGVAPPLWGLTRRLPCRPGVVAAARSYGLEASGRRWEIDDLCAARPPVVLWWRFDHFVVYEGIRRGRAQLNDPASGRRWVDAEELDQSFTGIALTFARTADFQPGGRRLTTITGSLVRRPRASVTASCWRSWPACSRSFPGWWCRRSLPCSSTTSSPGAIVRSCRCWSPG